MKINYCDLCGAALKDQFYKLYLASSSSEQISYGTLSEYYAYIVEAEKHVKEICFTCKQLIDKIFELRFENLNKIDNELLGIYNLPTKEKNEEKK